MPFLVRYLQNNSKSKRFISGKFEPKLATKREFYNICFFHFAHAPLTFDLVSKERLECFLGADVSKTITFLISYGKITQNSLNTLKNETTAQKTYTLIQTTGSSRRKSEFLGHFKCHLPF